MQKRAIILGAGPAGLVTAWKLLENGWAVEIYEKEGLVGGMCRTWKWEGFLVDTGPHIYHTPDSKLAAFWEKQFGDLFIKGEFWCKNVKGENFDEYWDYPLSWESISRYPKHLKERILHELKTRNLEDKAKAVNYTEYMEAEIGPTLRKMFFEKYPQKIWGVSTRKLTPDWAPKRIEFRQKATPFYHNQWNAVGKYGTGCIYERIQEHILNLNGDLHLNSEVKGIGYEGKRLSHIQFTNKKSLLIGPNDIVISTLPITSTVHFLGNESKLQFRGCCSIYLAYQQPYVLPKGIHWLYYDSEKVYFSRITEPKRLSPFTAPKDKTLLTVEVTYSKGDKIHCMEQEDLMRKVSEQVELVGLADRRRLIGQSINWEDFVYPLQYSGYQEELAKSRAVVSQFQQLHSIGAGGDFNYADSQILFHKAFDLVDILCGKDSSSTQVIRKTLKCKLKPSVIINRRKIGKEARTYIIAEAGLNHNGSLSIAKQLVDKAKETGCDAIKFQTFRASDRISNKVKSVRYAETIIGTEETLFEMFDRLAMSFEKQKELFAYAKKRDIEIFSTPFDIECVDFLESIGVGLYKIASMDLVNLPLIEYVAQKGKPIILSTGMSTLGQVEEAVEVVRQAGNPNLIILHCNSSYPAAPEEMNLKVMQTLKTAFNVPVGLSDHTFGLFVSHTAIALGADLIERHFTLDRMLEGPDHIMSSDPDELAELVQISHKIPAILGDGVKQIQPNEYDTINTQRKSLYAACDIQKGQMITNEMIAIKGPGGGLLPRYLDIVLGRIAMKDIEADYPIHWDDI
ncbi:N-acetylneuraminate synthase family protein [Thermodesulfobacteriota bacterium]